MKLRTRAILVALVLLVGFVLAAPFRKPLPAIRDRPAADQEAGVLVVTQPVLPHLSRPIVEESRPAMPGQPPSTPQSREVTTAAFVTAIRPLEIETPESRPAFGAAEWNPPPDAPMVSETDPYHDPAVPSTTFTTPGRPMWHRVVDGDSLADLASEYLGDRELFLRIFEANRDVLDSPHILPIGVDLRIPDPRREATPEKPPPEPPP